MSMVFRLPVLSNDGTLPVVPSSDLSPFTVFEFAAYEHWLLGGSIACLTGLKSGKVLSVQAAAPAYSASYLTVGGYGNALLSDLADKNSLTVCGVFKAPVLTSVNNSIVVGGTANSLNGSSVSIIGGTTVNSRVAVRGFTPIISDRTFTPVSGNWYFAAFAQKDRTSIPFIGGAANAQTTSSTDKTVGVNKVALGNAWDSSAVVNNGFDAAEFIIFDKGLSVAELEQVYARSKARMLTKGITVV